MEVDNPTSEKPVPGIDERAQDLRLMGTHRLDLGSGRAVEHCAPECFSKLRVFEVVGVDIANACHDDSLSKIGRSGPRINTAFDLIKHQAPPADLFRSINGGEHIKSIL